MIEKVSRMRANVDLLTLLRDRLGTVPDYETMLESCYRRIVRIGDTVVDVGAHEGRHTTVLAELVGESGRVLAFEPLPSFASALKSRFLGTQVEVIRTALSDRRGESDFIHARGVPSESGLRARAFNRPDLVSPEVIRVKLELLDDYLVDLNNLSFIKVDAEGAELSILEGGKAVISRHRPYVAVEYGAGTYEAYGLTRGSLFDLATELNYVIVDLFGGVCDDSETWSKVCDVVCWDWLLIPRERAAEWQHRFYS